MKITVKPVGLIKRFVEEQEMVIRDGLTCRRLIRDLKIPEELKMMAFVNGKRRGLDEQLHDRDEVKLVTILTGG
jgi:sulfur carrier protein ThiS